MTHLRLTYFALIQLSDISFTYIRKIKKCANVFQCCLLNPFSLPVVYIYTESSVTYFRRLVDFYTVRREMTLQVLGAVHTHPSL